MSLDLRFCQKLKAKIEEEITSQEVFLGGGLAQDFNDVKHRTGQILAYKNVLKMCDDTEKETLGVN